MPRILIVVIIGLSTVLLSACFRYYKLDIQQGNVVTGEMLTRLETGMTKRQVRYVLGTPLVQDPFHQDRWDYVYSFKEGSGKIIEQNRLAAFFKDDVLMRVEKNGVPVALPIEAGELEAQPGEVKLKAEETIVVKGDPETLEKAKKKKKKGFLRRTWNKIWR